MDQQSVRLSVPTLPEYARAVRMLAASLAVVCDMGVDDVEDVRMAAEEGFVYACSTAQSVCDVAFQLSGTGIEARFSLGEPLEGAEGEDADLDLAWLLMSAVSDDCAVSEDGAELCLYKAAGVLDGD